MPFPVDEVNSWGGMSGGLARRWEDLEYFGTFRHGSHLFCGVFSAFSWECFAHHLSGWCVRIAYCLKTVLIRSSVCWWISCATQVTPQAFQRTDSGVVSLCSCHWPCNHDWVRLIKHHIYLWLNATLSSGPRDATFHLVQTLRTLSGWVWRAVYEIWGNWKVMCWSTENEPRSIC